MSIKFCTECGHTYSLNANFCSGCGKKLHPEKPVRLQNNCRHCGTQISTTAVFCISCGEKVFKDETEPLLFEKTGTTSHITEEKTATEEILPDEESNSTSEKSKISINKESIPISESNSIISENKPLNTVLNDNTNNVKDIKSDPQPATNIKHTRLSKKRPIIMSLAVILVLLGVLSAYLNGWIKNPFNMAIPYDPETSVYAADMSDWKNNPDLKKEQDAIAKRQKELIANLEKNNIKKAIKYFYPEYQPAWQKQLEDDPEGTATLAAVLSTSEMVFLGEPGEPKDNPRSRTATFMVIFEQSGFYITWIKDNGIWYLYDF